MQFITQDVKKLRKREGSQCKLAVAFLPRYSSSKGYKDPNFYVPPNQVT